MIARRRGRFGRAWRGGRQNEAVCLVTGERGPIARLHPAIKGVWGAQSSGASIVSFNLDAFASYGHEQGDNAPVSEAAAFAYTTALNRFLEKGSGHRIQIGDASTVFWADASDSRRCRAEGVVEDFFEAREVARGDEKVGAQKVGAILEGIREGKPPRGISRRSCPGRPLLRAWPLAQRRATLRPILRRG